MDLRTPQDTQRITSSSPSDSGSNELIAVPIAFMRGGSSRGAFILADDLPKDTKLRHAYLLAAYGSPDARQIDGIGGSDPLTSKAAVVEKSARDDADVEYTFYQVGIDSASVSTGGNCGNMLAAVAPFAILRRLVNVTEPETCVRIYTTNTRQVVTARVSVRDGLPLCEGDCEIAGVPDPGAAIALDFGRCAGAVSGKLLPTGLPSDMIDVGGRQVEVSLIDAATPFAFVRAADIGAIGTETPDELQANAAVMQKLEEVRGWAAVVLGLASEGHLARSVTPNLPRVIMVASKADYTAHSGRTIGVSDIDLCVRQLAMQRPHKALAVTGAVCTAAASAVPGSVVQKLIERSSGDQVRLGHPSGVLRVEARTSTTPEGNVIVESAKIERTARLIIDGMLYLRRRKVEQLLSSCGMDA